MNLVIGFHLVKLGNGKMNTVVFVDQDVIGRAEEYQIRVCISLTDRHAGVAAWSVVLLGHDMRFLADDNWQR
jgi:hypothetical protein